MSNTTTQRLAIALATGAAILAMCLALSLTSPQSAHAGNFCSGYNAPAYLTSGYICYGGQQTVSAVYGSGNQHAVCVGVTQGYNVTCSHGPGEGTYDALGVTGSFVPYIMNRGGSTNTVYGVTY